MSLNAINRYQNEGGEMIPILRISKPIWNGGKPCVGVAEFRFKNHDEIHVDITYVRKKDGRRSYPYLYSVKREQALRYPTQVVSGGVALRVIPIGDLRIIENLDQM